MLHPSSFSTTFSRKPKKDPRETFPTTNQRFPAAFYRGKKMRGTYLGTFGRRRHAFWVLPPFVGYPIDRLGRWSMGRAQKTFLLLFQATLSLISAVLLGRAESALPPIIPAARFSMPPNPEFSDRLFGMSPAERGSFLLLSVQFIFGQSIKSLEPRTEENRVWERHRDRRRSRAGGECLA